MNLMERKVYFFTHHHCHHHVEQQAAIFIHWQEGSWGCQKTLYLNGFRSSGIWSLFAGPFSKRLAAAYGASGCTGEGTQYHQGQEPLALLSELPSGTLGSETLSTIYCHLVNAELTCRGGA